MSATTIYSFIHCKLTFGFGSVKLKTLNDMPLSGIDRQGEPLYDDNGRWRGRTVGDLMYTDITLNCAKAEWDNLIMPAFDNDDEALTNPNNRFTMTLTLDNEDELISYAYDDCIFTNSGDAVSRNGEARTDFTIAVGSRRKT